MSTAIAEKCSECVYSDRAGPADNDDWVCNYAEVYMTREVTDCTVGIKCAEYTLFD